MYKHKYVDRAPEQPSIWTIGGTAFHQLAEWYLAGTLGADPAEQLLWDAWLQAWTDAVEEEVAKNPLATPDLSTWRKAARGAEDAAWWKANGFRMVRDFTNWWDTSGLQVLELDGEPAVERRFEVELGGVHVLVIPDALVVDEHGQVNVLDYKSGKPPKKSLQLGVYKAGVKAATGLDVTWGLYFMTRAVRLLPVDLHQWPADKIAEMFAEFDHRERSGDYAPTPGDHCSFCPLRRDCPVSAKK
jgi:hypothetical protein